MLVIEKGVLCDPNALKKVMESIKGLSIPEGMDQPEIAGVIVRIKARHPDQSQQISSDLEAIPEVTSVTKGWISLENRKTSGS